MQCANHCARTIPDMIISYPIPIILRNITVLEEVVILRISIYYSTLKLLFCI